MKRRLFCLLIILFCLACPVRADAIVIKRIGLKENTSLPRLTVSLQKKISATTPQEPDSSDLDLVHPAARIYTARLPQGFATDGRYYYYLSQMSTGSNDLRLTRIMYKEDGSYQASYMTLKDFGHGTNLDCVTYKGKTWLWTGACAKGETSTAITCFLFKKGKILKKKGSYCYHIPSSARSRSHVSNVYPAIDPSGKRLAVRYTGRGRQYYQFYKLTKGTKINPGKIVKKISRKNTSGPFQGFDIRGTTVYTIEGSARQSEMKIKKKPFFPIRIRSYDYATKKSATSLISGASKLSHREPEGIQLQEDGRAIINIASHYKDLYTCMNIYSVK